MTRGISIHIGLNQVSTQHYGANVAPLSTCEQDAKDMQALATTQDFKSSFLLLSENATRSAVASVIQLASQELKSGDILFLSYSGHGAYVFDTSGDEDDNLDETWCLYDGQFLDDELLKLWTLFEEGVRILILSDSCHSGSVAKAFPNAKEEENKLFQTKLLAPKVAQEVYLKNIDYYQKIEETVGNVKESDIKASVKLLAACQDPQVSYTLTFAKNSIFTEKLKDVWSRGTFDGNYEQFFERIRDEVSSLDFLPTVQTPNLLNIGSQNEAFDKAKPFSI